MGREGGGACIAICLTTTKGSYSFGAVSIKLASHVIIRTIDCQDIFCKSILYRQLQWKLVSNRCGNIVTVTKDNKIQCITASSPVPHEWSLSLPVENHCSSCSHWEKLWTLTPHCYNTLATQPEGEGGDRVALSLSLSFSLSCKL